MAIKAFTRKPVGTGSSDKFLEKYEELLKRNKGGRLLTGYEASSQNPIYIPGKVINPTGLGETAQQSAQRSASRLPQYGEMSVEEFGNILNEIDLTKLTPEERKQLSQTIGEYSKDADLKSEIITGEVERPLPNPNFVAPTAPVMGPPTPTGMLKRNRSKEERTTRETIGEVMGPPSPKKEVMGPPSPETLNFENYIKTNQGIADQATDMLNKPTQTPEEIDAEMQYLKINNPAEYNRRIAESWGRGADRFQMGKTGQTPEQLQEESTMELSVPEGFEKTEDGGIRRKETGMRGEIGDALDVLATYLKLPETGLSEKIAGRPTKNTVVARAAEPAPEVQQAGSGLERLRDDMSYSPSAMSGRPDFSSIGLKRSVGNVAGVAGQSAVSPASSPISPSGQTMESVARVNEGGSPVVSNISANPMMQSIGVGTNQPAQVRTQQQSQPQQNNQQNNQQSQPRQNQPQQMGPPAPKQTTSYKAPTPVSKVFAPTNLGVGSNQPAKVQPVSQPAPKQNVVQTVTKAVSSFLSNLFRRK